MRGRQRGLLLISISSFCSNPIISLSQWHLQLLSHCLQLNGPFKPIFRVSVLYQLSQLHLMGNMNNKCAEQHSPVLCHWETACKEYLSTKTITLTWSSMSWESGFSRPSSGNYYTNSKLYPQETWTKNKTGHPQCYWHIPISRPSSCLTGDLNNEHAVTSQVSPMNAPLKTIFWVTLPHQLDKLCLPGEWHFQDHPSKSIILIQWALSHRRLAMNMQLPSQCQWWTDCFRPSSE